VQSSGVIFRFYVAAVIKHIIPIILSSLGCARNGFSPKAWEMSHVDCSSENTTEVQLRV